MRFGWFSRLEGRFTLAAALSAGVPLLIVGAVAWYGLSRSYLRTAGERLDSEAARLQAQLDTRIGLIAGVLRQVLIADGDDDWALRAAGMQLPEVVQLQLRRGRKTVALWSRFEVVPHELEPVARSDVAETWGPVRPDSWGEPQLTLGLSDYRGRMLDARLRAPLLWEALVELHQPNLHAYLLDRDGRRIASSNLVEVLRGAGVPREVLQAAPGRVFRFRDVRGVEQLAVARSVDKLGGRLVVEAPVAALLAPLRTALLLLLATVLLALAASAWPGWRLARAVTRPLDELARGAGELERGELDAPLRASGPPEARSAVQAFNRMATELKRSHQELARYAAELEERVDERTEALRLALQRALEADSAKTRFLASVSHELRTPLANIKGFASTMLASDVTWRPQEAEEFLRIIEGEADRMHYLVNDLLDLAKGGRGEFAVSKQPQHPARLLRSLMERLQSVAAGRELRLKLDSNLPCLQVDAERLRSVLVNLVENAAKYSTAGQPIELSVNKAEGYLRFAVRDYGPGMRPETADRAFQPFFRGDESTSGSGLGLAIAKEIIAAHGGDIGVISDGGGTEVWFTLPLEGVND